MDFAKKLLNKYGWKEGDGLGKNNDGIAKPLKASLKFDNAGLGADQASDFNNHWWERVFNEAAQNVEVKKEEDGGVSMNLKNEDNAVEITTKGYSMKKLKKAKRSMNSGNLGNYDNFLQSATLTKAGNEMEKSDKIDFTDIAVKEYKVLTDEELFRACGGRTAHKGARHGLRLSGKLERLEKQEQELVAKLQEKLAKSIEDTAKATLPIDKKVKRKRNTDTELYGMDVKIIKQTEETTIAIDRIKKNKSKMQKSSNRGGDNLPAHLTDDKLDDAIETVASNEMNVKKKKSKRDKTRVSEEVQRSKKKCKKTKKETEEIQADDPQKTKKKRQ